MRTILLMMVLAVISGCTSTGVVPIGEDTFMISKHGSGFNSGGALKADCYQEGNAYCTSLGMKFQPVSDNFVDGAPGRSASAEIQFRCLSKGDAELGRPTMKPIANVRIENDIHEKKEIKEAPAQASVTDKLKELESIHKQGLITDAEYTAKKQEILKSM